MDSLGSVLNRISTIDMNARRYGLNWTSPPEGTYQAPIPTVDGGAADAADAAPGPHVSGGAGQAGSFAQTLEAAHSTTKATPRARVPSRSAVHAATSTAHATAKPVTHAVQHPVQPAVQPAAQPAAATVASASVAPVAAPTRAPATVSAAARVTADVPAPAATTQVAAVQPSGATVSTRETILPSYYPTDPGTQPSVHGTDVGTYTPAMELAQWQEIARTGTYLPNASGPGLSILPGTPRYPAPQSTIDAGLAQAQARAKAAGITDTQVQAATDALAQQLAAGNYAAAGGPGYADVTAQAAAGANYDSGWYQSGEAKNQLAQMIASYDQAAAKRTEYGITEAEPAEVGLARASY